MIQKILLSLFVFLVLTMPVYALSTDKAEYQINEKVTITAQIEFGDELSIQTPSDRFRFLGGNNELSFIPREVGRHIVILDGKNPENISFEVVEPQRNIEIDITKNNYKLNDVVPINIIGDLSTNDEIRVISGDNTYVFLSSDDTFAFSPKVEGIHYVRIVNDGKIIAENQFEVSSSQPVLIKSELLSIDKKRYELGQKVAIYIDANIGSGVNLVIHGPDQNYVHFNVNKDLEFEPIKIGSYNLQLVQGSNILETITFNVGENPNSQQPKDVVVITDPVPKVIDFEIFDHKNSKLNYNVKIIENGKLVSELIESRMYDVDLLPSNHPVKRMEINNYRATTKGLKIGLDLVDNIASVNSKNTMQAYAINTDEVDFDIAYATINARGNELYKCALWNYTLQSCLGSWEKVMDIIPGQDYQIEVYPGDPGYVETGVATINSVKPIYHPGDRAELLVAILDNQGFLATQANITLNITDPLGSVTTYTTDDMNLTEFSLGLYYSHYDNTTNEGNYTLFVKATNELGTVNSSMFSKFSVQDYYPYDIIRSVPLSVDPWQGPFTSNITIESFSTDESITVTEIIPSEFAIVDSGGAFVTNNIDHSILSWDIEPGDTVSYRVQPPLVTPDLYSLGPITVYDDSGSFVEPRTWFVAIDPFQNATGCRSSLDGSASDTLPDWSGTLNNDCTDSDASNDWKEELQTQDDGNAYDRNLANGVEIYLQTNHSVQNLDCSAVNFFEVCIDMTGVGKTSNCWLHVSNSVSSTLPNTPSSWEELVDGSAGACQGTTYAGCFTATTVDTCSEISNAHVRATFSRTLGGQITQATPSYDYVKTNYSVVTAPPTVALTYPPDSATFSSGTIQFTFRPTDQTGISSCNLVVNGFANQSNTSLTVKNNQLSNITANFGDGSYSWTVNCSDIGGSNLTNLTTRTFSIDVTAPSSFELLEPADNTISNDTTPTLVWSQTTETNFQNYTIVRSDDFIYDAPPVDNVYERSFTVTNTTFTPTSGWLSNRPHYWWVTAYDQGGLSSTAAYFNYTIDTVPPTSFNLISPENTIVSNSLLPLFNWSDTSDTNFANYTLLIDDESTFALPYVDQYFNLRTVTNNTRQLLPGEDLPDNTIIYWKVIAVDKAGQTRESSSVFTYQTDNTDPTIELIEPQNKSYSSTTIALNYSRFDVNLHTCAYSLDGGVRTTILNCLNTSFVTSQGGHNLILIVNDTAGNNVNASVNFSIDATNPNIVLNGPINNSYLVSQEVNFNFTPFDTNLDTCVLYGDFGGSWSSNYSNSSVVSNQLNKFIPVILDEGYYTWNVLCNDTSSRFSFNETNYTFTVDVTPPIINLSEPTNNTLEAVSNGITFTYNVTDSITSVDSCEIILSDVIRDTDNSPVEGQNSFSLFVGNGLYNWSVNCTDISGLESQSNIFNLSVSVIDEDAPIIDLNQPVEGRSFPYTDLTFNFTPQDATGINSCSVLINNTINATCFNLSQGPADCSLTNQEYSTINITGFNDGVYNWSIRCIDNGSDNLQGNSSQRIFTIDTKKPNVSITSPTDQLYNSSKNILLSYQVNETNLNKCVYSLNLGSNVTLNNCENILFNTTVGGLNNITLYVNDTAGNMNVSFQEFNVSINATIGSEFDPPTITVYGQSNLRVNYSDEYSNPIIGAMCVATDSYNSYLTGIGSVPISLAKNDGAVEVYSQTILRVDFTNVPQYTDKYYLFFNANRQWLVNDSLRVYFRCDGQYDLGQEHRVAEIEINDGVLSPDFNQYVIPIEYTNITSSTCSAIFESNYSNSLSQSWAIADIDSGLNPSASYVSDNLGQTFNLRTDNTSFVDLGYVVQNTNLTYNSSSDLYEYQRIYYENIGSYELNAHCSLPGKAIGINTTAILSVNDNVDPIVDINEIDPQVLNYSKQNVSIYWTANDLLLDNKTLNVYYPNGTKVGSYYSGPILINTTLLTTSGTYSINAFANDTSGNFENDSSTFTILDENPKYYDIQVNPTSPQIFSPTRLYQFNVTWNDTNNNLESVWVEHNFTGTFQNYSVTAQDGDVFVYNYTAIWGGAYVWRSHANDSNGNLNSTPYQNYQITKQSSKLHLFLNGSMSNITINQSDFVNISAIMQEPLNGSINLYYNGSLIKTADSPNQIIQQFTHPGKFNVTAIFPENRNYTANRSNFSVNVVDNVAPFVQAMQPADLEIDQDGDLIFQYNITELGPLDYCELLINESQIDNSSSVTNGSALSFSTSQQNGDYNWSVQCFDLAGNSGRSDIRLFTVDIVIVELQIRPISCADSEVSCNANLINTTDADSETHGNIQLGSNYVYANLSQVSIKPGSNISYVNITWDKSQDLTSGEGTFSLHYLDESGANLICSGDYQGSGQTPVNCSFPQPYPSIDEFNDGLELRADFARTRQGGNWQYETFLVTLHVTYAEDVTPPLVELVYPEDSVQLGVGNIEFNYTASDATGIKNCTLIGDFGGSFEPNVSNTTAVDGGTNSLGPVYLDAGFYNWNVQCFDLADNPGYAEFNRTINITLPDLSMQSSNITFSNNSPSENSNITISANIYNSGLSNADQFVVQFYSGLPSSENQIKNVTVNNLSALTAYEVLTNYTVNIGPNNISVRIDYNNSVEETDETNNLINNTLHVSGYTLYYGNLTSQVVLPTITNSSFQSWTVQNASANIYVVDADSQVDFSSLVAIGRSVVGAESSTDFEELDIAFGMTSYNDSISKIWTTNGETPIEIRNYTLYENLIQDVPVIQSAPGSPFYTGILWDSSDDDSANDIYDSIDSEDVVLVNSLQGLQEGQYGYYNYELKVMTLMRSYVTPNSANNVVFYVELLN